MGYACPVCEAPQADGEHLADHLAFTAMLGDDDHEAWLDDRVPDWGERGPEELAPDVVEFAEEREYDRVFEDGADRPPAGETGDADADGEHADAASFEDRMARELRDDSGDRVGGDDAGGRGHRGEDAGRTGKRRGSGPIDVPDAGELDDEAEAILEEAREMTREMYGDREREEGETDAGSGGESE